MHEISLVQGLLNQLHEITRREKASKVLQITMRIGPLSGVVIDSFRFGFDILAKDREITKNAELIIEETEVLYRCTRCRHEEESPRKRPDACSRCGELFLIAEGGEELILQNVIME